MGGGIFVSYGKKFCSGQDLVAEFFGIGKD